MATPLKRRLVVFSKWLLIGYIRLGYIKLGNWPRRNRAPAGARNRKKAPVKKNEETLLKGRCNKMNYTQTNLSHLRKKQILQKKLFLKIKGLVDIYYIYPDFYFFKTIFCNCVYFHLSKLISKINKSEIIVHTQKRKNILIS